MDIWFEWLNWFTTQFSSSDPWNMKVFAFIGIFATALACYNILVIPFRVNSINNKLNDILKEIKNGRTNIESRKSNDT